MGLRRGYSRDVICWDDSLSSFNYSLLHLNRSMFTMKFMIQSYKSEQLPFHFIPHALQIGLPSSSRRHKGVFVVPQF